MITLINPPGIKTFSGLQMHSPNPPLGLAYIAAAIKDAGFPYQVIDGTGEARVYDVDKGNRVSTFDSVKTPVYSVAFHPNGKLVATAGFDGIVRLSDPISGKLVKEFVPVPSKK